jgi:hypothetical protein
MISGVVGVGTCVDVTFSRHILKSLAPNLCFYEMYKS